MWKAKMQTFVAKSTFEAEYGALSTLVTEMVWCKCLMNEIKCWKTKGEEEASTVLVDNQGAVKAANQQRITHRNKTVAIKFHHVRDQVEKKVVRIKHVRTNLNLADVLTKAVVGNKFEMFADWMLGNNMEAWLQVLKCAAN